MRKYFFIGAVVATALIAVLQTTVASAASAHVLTTGKAGGAAVRPGAILKASLAKGTGAVVANSLGKLTCTKSAFTAKVITNPARPGTAKVSITGLTFSNCKISVRGLTITGQSVGNLPYNATVSDARGNPVHISGRNKAQPVLLSATVKVGTATFRCLAKAASVSGSWSNKGNAVVLVKVKLTKAAGSFSGCPTSGTFSATYGPVRDTSVKGSPAVFVS